MALRQWQGKQWTSRQGTAPSLIRTICHHVWLTSSKIYSQVYCTSAVVLMHDGDVWDKGHAGAFYQ